MTLEEIIGAVSIEGVSKKSSVFDIRKLEWLNGQYLNEMPSGELFETVAPLFVERGFIKESELEGKREYILAVIGQLKERCRLISDFAGQGAFYFTEPAEYEEKGVKKHFKNLSVAERLDTLADKFDSLDSFTEQALEDATRKLAEELEISGAKLIHPVRLAATGLTYGPGLFELLSLVGREKVVSRMRSAAEYIREKRQ